MQCRDEARDGSGGIRDGAAVDAAVQIDRGAVDAHFHRSDAAQAVGEGGRAGRDHPGVADGDQIAAECIAVCREKIREVLAADFFLALDQEDQVHRQLAFFAQRLADAEDVREDLALVVRRAARINDSVAHDGLEWRRGPLGERLDRLHVVVAVDHHRAAAGLVLVARGDDGMPSRRMKLGLQPDCGELLHKPLRAFRDVARVARLGGDAGETDEGKEIVEVPAVHRRTLTARRGGGIAN